MYFWLHWHPVQIMMGLTTFDEQIKAGKVTFKGDRKTFDQLRVAMSDFELFFEIMPGTGENKPSQQKKTSADRKRYNRSKYRLIMFF